jgi:N-acetylneuraminic acid mutarotase
MIVWGGFPGYLNTGGRYNPSTNSWTITSTINAPAGRENHTAVWTGNEMIVWGGEAGVGNLQVARTV